MGTFLYYAQALDNTMLVALNDIGTQQAQPTTQVMDKVQQLLDYASTYPQVYIRFYASDMQLHVDTDAAFLVLPKACSRIAGYFRFLNNQVPHIQHHDNNGAIFIECKTLCSVVTSAAESETHGVFHNATKILPLRHLLTDMGHIQTQPTPVRTDNSTAAGFTNKNMIMKHSKTWDMQLHWLQDPNNNKHFKVFWDKGINNGADYHTKHHSTIHHRRVRMDKKYVRDIHQDLQTKINCLFSPKNVTNTLLRGCVHLSHTSVSNSVIQQSLDVTGTSRSTVRPNSKYFGVSASGKLEVC